MLRYHPHLAAYAWIKLCIPRRQAKASISASHHSTSLLRTGNCFLFGPEGEKDIAVIGIERSNVLRRKNREQDVSHRMGYVFFRGFREVRSC